MEVEPPLPRSELKRLERVEKDADRSRHLRIVILGTEGWTAPAVAMAVGLSRRICQRWIARTTKTVYRESWSRTWVRSRRMKYHPIISMRRSTRFGSFSMTSSLNSEH